MFAYITAAAHFNYQRVRFAEERPTGKNIISVNTVEAVTEEVEDFGASCFGDRLAGKVRGTLGYDERYQCGVHRGDPHIVRKLREDEK